MEMLGINNTIVGNNFDPNNQQYFDILSGQTEDGNVTPVSAKPYRIPSVALSDNVGKTGDGENTKTPVAEEVVFRPEVIKREHLVFETDSASFQESLLSAREEYLKGKIEHDKKELAFGSLMMDLGASGKDTPKSEAFILAEKKYNELRSMFSKERNFRGLLAEVVELRKALVEAGNTERTQEMLNKANRVWWVRGGEGRKDSLDFSKKLVSGQYFDGEIATRVRPIDSVVPKLKNEASVLPDKILKSFSMNGVMINLVERGGRKEIVFKGEVLANVFGGLDDVVFGGAPLKPELAFDLKETEMRKAYSLFYEMMVMDVPLGSFNHKETLNLSVGNAVIFQQENKLVAFLNGQLIASGDIEIGLVFNPELRKSPFVEDFGDAYNQIIKFYQTKKSLFKSV